MSGAKECGGYYIIHHLFGQGGGVDNHAVLAAGFGNKGYRAAGALGQLLVNGLGGVGGAGKGDAGDSAVWY